MLSRIVLFLILFYLSIPTFCQQPVSSSENPVPVSFQQTVETLFGGGFKLDPKYQPLMADFDSDGAEDLALVTFGKNPLANSAEYAFKVADPYDSYFGFGDPKITAKFSDFGDGSSHCVMIVHDWRSPKPKAKFVIVNLPFEKLGVGATTYKKKSIVGLAAEEGVGLNAIVFWDGKKYRWEPSDFSTSFDQLKDK